MKISREGGEGVRKGGWETEKGHKERREEPRAALAGRRASAIRINLLALAPHQPGYPLRKQPRAWKRVEGGGRRA